jgi:DNA-binding transcriptional MerR regulator
MLKIGDFSKTCQVPIKTLRYYDEIGLLKPASVDNFTGYRRYTIEQIPRLNRILALKDLGFSLKQVAELLDEKVTSEQLSGMLKMKQAEVSRELEETQSRLDQIAYRLMLIEQENKMPQFEILVKDADPLQVASVRQVLPNYKSAGQLYPILFGALAQAKISSDGPLMSIYHDEGYKVEDVDLEVAVPIADAHTPGEILNSAAGGSAITRTLEASLVASTMFRGPYSNFSLAYGAILDWVSANGYTITGPNREIYFQGPSPDVDPADYVTEIQFPVKKE